jgi:hypothetical protein
MNGFAATVDANSVVAIRCGVDARSTWLAFLLTVPPGWRSCLPFRLALVPGPAGPVILCSKLLAGPGAATWASGSYRDRMLGRQASTHF